MALPMKNGSKITADLILDGLAIDPVVGERLMRRVAQICWLRQLEQGRSGRSDEDWVTGYANGWGDAGDLFGGIANLIGDGYASR